MTWQPRAPPRPAAAAAQRESVSSDNARQQSVQRARLQQRKHRRSGMTWQHAPRAHVQRVRRRGESAAVRRRGAVIGAPSQQRQQRRFVAGSQRRQRRGKRCLGR